MTIPITPRLARDCADVRDCGGEGLQKFQIAPPVEGVEKSPPRVGNGMNRQDEKSKAFRMCEKSKKTNNNAGFHCVFVLAFRSRTTDFQAKTPGKSLQSHDRRESIRIREGANCFFSTLKSYYFMQSRTRRGIIPDFNKFRERVLKGAKKPFSTPLKSPSIHSRQGIIKIPKGC
jgi:hypothetical protein